MILSVLVSCETEMQEITSTDAETEAVESGNGETEVGETEAVDTDTETDTETETDTDGGETGTLNYDPVELESKRDMVPDYEGYENLSKDYLQPYSVWVEGENFTASSVPFSKTAASNASGGYVYYSGQFVPDEWKQSDFDINKYEKNFDVVYEITVPASGYYRLTTSAGDRNHFATTDFSVIVDDKTPIHCLDAKVIAQVPHIGNSSLGELFELLDMGVFYLERGEHRIVFRMDNVDGYTDKRSSTELFRRISFMIDYFVLNRVYSDNDAPIVAYDADISADPNVDILKAAANMNVFDQSYPIQIDYIHFFEETGRGNYTITDHAGNVILRRYFTGEANDIQRVAIGIKNHPTGYFKLQAGDYVEYYLVVPSLADRKVTDSPFAMDSAISQLVVGSMQIGDVDRLASYAAVYRMAGVTWVRERMSWSYYQTGRAYNEETGKYEYTYNDNYAQVVKTKMDILKDAGLNILMIFSSAPNWAKQVAADLPGSQIVLVKDPNKPNSSTTYLGTYDTQLAVYDAAKRAATVLDGTIDIIELMNEPDHTYRDIAEHYSGWFKAAALGVIDSGSDMPISIAGMCQPTNWKDFMALTMSSDVMSYSSIYNYHSHKDLPADVSVPDYGESVTMRNFPVALSLWGVTKPVWITESGMKMPSETPTDLHLQKQAPYIVTSAVQSLSYGIDKYFWFVGAPYLEAGGDYGSFSKNDRAYPIIGAYSVMTDVLGEGKYIGELSDLPDDVRGYLFNTGERVVAVIWRTKKTGVYTFKADAPVLITSMMGEQMLRSPNEKGTISVNVGTEPIYITYSIPPEEYYDYVFEEDEEIVQPTLDFGDRIIITPEFEGYIFDEATKTGGHKITDGSVINVRVVNLNDVGVTGKVSVTIPGFTIEGLDTVVTVQPHDEEFITLTLRKTGPELFDDHVTFTGKFWDATKTEAEGVACSPTAVNVDANEKGIVRNIYFSLSGNLQSGKKIDPKILKNTTVYIDGFREGSTVKILIDGKEFTNFKLTESESDGDEESARKYMELEMDLSDLVPGKYMIYIGVITQGGDMQVLGLYLRYDGETVLFTTTR